MLINIDGVQYTDTMLPQLIWADDLQKLKGMQADIFRNANGYDCTCDGVSARHITVTIMALPPSLVRYGRPLAMPVTQIFKPHENAPLLFAYYNVRDHMCLIEPCALMTEFGGPMFGGHFAWSSDSRFPHYGPIPVHDRFETPDLLRKIGDEWVTRSQFNERFTEDLEFRIAVIDLIRKRNEEYREQHKL